jgi:hypothetical protein
MRSAGRHCPRRSHAPGRSLLLLEQLETRLCPVVPAYSSLPGANQTIYLDFDGHITQNTQWNSYWNTPTITSPAYDTDGNPSSFSASELADIQDAWNRIAEDFYPFNVNVTTVDPGVEALRKFGLGDTQWGVRVVITRDTQATGAGGITFIDSFNWDTDTAAFVYVTGGKNVAEAASHEIGHSLGLSHDGTATSSYYAGYGSGETSWAPLMGVGYYTNVTQWDRGEYYGSNNAGPDANYSKGPDDLAIITSYNGFGYRPDDYGNSMAAASPLALSGSSVSGAGLISTTSDADFFSFTTGAGPVTLNMTPFTPGPDLDIRADLYDAAGNLVATSNSASTLSASFALNLAAGQYFLKIDGTGFGNPGSNPPSGYSDYATLGRYFISGTIVAGSQPAQISLGDVTVNENAGTATFTVSLTGTLTSNATVSYATANGTALTPGDYLAASGTLTFTPGGPTTQTLTVSIVNDATTESSENFYVNLSNVSGASVLDGQGQGTIVDDDVAPSVSIAVADANKPEGTSLSSTPFTFTVTRLGSAAATASVNWSVAGIGGGKGSATANDFAGGAFPSGVVTFAVGESSKTVTVSVNADSSKEQNEKFRVSLSNPVGTTLGTATADGTMVNDDSGGPSHTLIPHKFPLPGEKNFADEVDTSAASQQYVNHWAPILQSIVTRASAVGAQHLSMLQNEGHAAQRMLAAIPMLAVSAAGQLGVKVQPAAAALLAHAARPQNAAGTAQLADQLFLQWNNAKA